MQISSAAAAVIQDGTMLVTRTSVPFVQLTRFKLLLNIILLFINFLSSFSHNQIRLAS